MTTTYNFFRHCYLRFHLCFRVRRYPPFFHSLLPQTAASGGLPSYCPIASELRLYPLPSPLLPRTAPLLLVLRQTPPFLFFYRFWGHPPSNNVPLSPSRRPTFQPINPSHSAMRRGDSIMTRIGSHYGKKKKVMERSRAIWGKSLKATSNHIICLCFLYPFCAFLCVPIRWRTWSHVCTHANTQTNMHAYMQCFVFFWSRVVCFLVVHFTN